MARQEFPADSYRRFHMRVQISRVVAYWWVMLMGFSFKWMGLFEFKVSQAVGSNCIGVVSAFLFLFLHKYNFEQKTGFKLFPIWAVIDTLAVTVAVHSGHDPGGPFFMMYVLNVGAAAFVGGGRAALVTFAMNTLAFVVAIRMMSTPEAFWFDFKRGMMPYTLLFSMLVITFAGIASLRNKRLKIKILVAEKNKTVDELEKRRVELERANTKVREANETKSKFLASVSHELRTPLNSIIGFSEILIPRTEDRLSEREQKFLQNIQVSGHHLLALINDILDLAKVEAGKMVINLASVDVNEVAEGVCVIMQGYCRKRGVTIIQDLEDDIPSCTLDQARLKQILYNLLSNAVKFSREGGRVYLKNQALPADRNRLGVDAISFTVIDHGPGIKEEDFERIFDEFQKVEEETGTNPEGTGLGLPLVRKFCTMMGGHIEVESELGSGSTFTVVLPQDATPFKETPAPAEKSL